MNVTGMSSLQKIWILNQIVQAYIMATYKRIMLAWWLLMKVSCRNDDYLLMYHAHMMTTYEYVM